MNVFFAVKIAIQIMYQNCQILWVCKVFFILQAETNSWQFARKVKKKGDHKFAIWCGNSTTYLAKSDLSTKKPQPICFGQASLRILIAKRHVICTHIGTKSSYVHIHILRNMNVWRSFPLNIHTFTTGQVKDESLEDKFRLPTRIVHIQVYKTLLLLSMKIAW